MVGYLRPVPSSLQGEASNDARLMAEWRNLHRRAFFTWITATEESTAAWLAQHYAPSNHDIMFMVETAEKTAYGHLALYNFDVNSKGCEFGRVLRGSSIGPKGGMAHAIRSLTSWAVATLGIREFFLEVFRDNLQAISLYARCGFHTTATYGLQRVDTAECIRWEKISGEHLHQHGIDGHALRMELKAEPLDAQIS